MSLADDLEAALVGRTDVVAVGVDRELVPAVLSARRRTEGGTWCVASPPSVAADLSRSLAAGSAAAEAVDRGRLRYRVAEAPRAPRTLFVASDRAFALAGPAGDRRLVDERTPDRVAAATAAVERRFAAARPAAVGMAGRSRLVRAARGDVGRRFAEDLADVLAGLDIALDRSGPVDDRTLLVALAARHDRLYGDVRRWADDVGIAPKAGFADAREALVDRGLVESIKVPTGAGRPNARLRLVDRTLLGVAPEAFVRALRERFEAPT